jgi:hypothetical protein
LEAVDALSASDVWTINLLGTVTEQWNGTQWTAVPPPSALPAGFRTAGGSNSGGTLSGLAGGRRVICRRGVDDRFTSALFAVEVDDPLQ